jgi:hypothetical protein
MKQKLLLSSFLLCLSLLGLTACFKDNRVVFAGILAEFNETVVRTPALGVAYPLIGVRNAAGQVTTRVNLVGAQQPSEQVLRVSVDPVSTAQAANYRFGGTVTIPANSSFGDLQFEVLNAACPRLASTWCLCSRATKPCAPAKTTDGWASALPRNWAFSRKLLFGGPSVHSLTKFFLLGTPGQPKEGWFSQCFFFLIISQKNS